MDEFTRECLAIDVGRRITSDDVLERLTELFVLRGAPAYLRSDNGPEFTALVVREWLERVGVKTLYIEPGSCGVPKLHPYLGKSRSQSPLRSE
jgi:transposase InsO family protein